MLGTTTGGILLAATVLFTMFVAVGAGALTAFILRQPWGIKSAAIDTVVAFIVWFLAAWVVLAIDTAHGVIESRVSLVGGISVSCVVARHLMSLILHRVKRES